MNTEMVQKLIHDQFPALVFDQDLESQLSSIETMELLLVLEKSLGFQLQAIELEPLLMGNFNRFCQIINGKRS